MWKKWIWLRISERRHSRSRFSTDPTSPKTFAQTRAPHEQATLVYRVIVHCVVVIGRLGMLEWGPHAGGSRHDARRRNDGCTAVDHRGTSALATTHNASPSRTSTNTFAGSYPVHVLRSTSNASACASAATSPRWSTSLRTCARRNRIFGRTPGVPSQKRASCSAVAIRKLRDHVEAWLPGFDAMMSDQRRLPSCRRP